MNFYLHFFSLVFVGSSPKSMLYNSETAHVFITHIDVNMTTASLAKCHLILKDQGVIKDA